MKCIIMLYNACIISVVSVLQNSFFWICKFISWENYSSLMTSIWVTKNVQNYSWQFKKLVCFLVYFYFPKKVRYVTLYEPSYFLFKLHMVMLFSSWFRNFQSRLPPLLIYMPYKTVTECRKKGFLQRQQNVLLNFCS